MRRIQGKLKIVVFIMSVMMFVACSEGNDDNPVDHLEATIAFGSEAISQTLAE